VVRHRVEVAQVERGIADDAPLRVDERDARRQMRTKARRLLLVHRDVRLSGSYIDLARRGVERMRSGIGAEIFEGDGGPRRDPCGHRVRRQRERRDPGRPRQRVDRETGLGMPDWYAP